MFRTISTIAITILVVLFGMQNFDHVPIYFFLGKAANIRVIFVIAIAGVSGYLIRSIIGIRREEHLKQQLQTLLRQVHKRNRKVTPIDEDM